MFCLNRLAIARGFATLAILPLMLTAYSCGSGSSSGVVGAECIGDEDCNQGLFCNSVGQCINAECIADADCGEGRACRNHRCQDIVVDGDTGGCSIDSDCDPGYECILPEGFCQQVETGCVTADDCPPGKYCADDGTCRYRNEADVDITDGDTPDGDPSTDGDIPDGDIPDGDTSDGDLPDGDPEEDSEPPCDMSIDTDNDLIPDCIEDSNGNGVVDPFETDPENPDSDEDGLPDGVEDANQDGIRQPNETSPLDDDTDFDRLKDGEEDINHNGIRDPGETDPLDPDSDDDNVIDGNELNGAYSNGSSDPLNRDTDGDTLPDGVEDKNGNGIFEPEYGETDPTLADTDGDGTPDNEESISLICEESAIREINLHSNLPGNWTLALLPDFSYVELDMLASSGTLLAAAFDEASTGVSGFILARDLSAGRVSEQVSNDNNLLSTLPLSGGLNHRGRNFQTYDGFDAMTGRYGITVASTSTGDIRNRVLGLLSGRNPAAIVDLPPASGPTATEFVLLSETIVRLDDGNAVVVFTVLTKDQYDDQANPYARILASDITDGSAIAQRERSTLDSCDADIGKPIDPVDILWVVDSSGSMSEDQQAVADAASTFSRIMTSAGIDFRVGVTSTACTSGELGQHKLTTSMSNFQSDIQSPPCGSSEYGLKSGKFTILDALGAGLPENERLRNNASLIVVFLSDEEDQEYEDCEPLFPNWPFDPMCQPNVLTNYQNFYKDQVHATCFAIVGDIPDGCGGASEGAGEGSGEAGTAYVEVAYHTNGVFGSICAPDFSNIMEEILRAAAGTASTYELAHHPISSTIRVMVEGTEIPRNPTSGFEYDVVSETIVFYGYHPEVGDDVVISYRLYHDDPKQ